MTLDELFQIDTSERAVSTGIDEPGFSTLYVRLGPRYLPGDEPGEPTPKVFTIANVVVNEQERGTGLFTTLVKHLFDKGFIVYVECINNERLRNHLLRNEFQDAALHSGYKSLESLYKKPEKNTCP